MTFLTLHPSKVIELIKDVLGTPFMGVSFMLNPVPASRPRVTRWGTYYAKTYTDWRKQAMALIKEQSETIGNHVTVLVEQIVSKPKTSKKLFPRGDVDNYAKAPTDILTTKKFWKDDDLITGLWTSKRFAEVDEEPRTEVTIYVHKTTDTD
jgi:Holliday junction resolvase RusA-like endonuclease